MSRDLALTLAVVTGVALTATSRTAYSQDAGDPIPPPCTAANLGGRNPIIVTGSTAVEPFLDQIAGAVDAAGFRIVYSSGGSCIGVNSVIAPDGGTITRFQPSSSTDRTRHVKIIDGVANNTYCQFQTDTVADVGASDVFSTSCPGTPSPPADAGDFFGPNQVMTFVVPKSSSQNAISAQAAHFVFGFGGQGGKPVSPWTDPYQYYVRNSASGTQQMIARAAFLDAARWWGINAGGSGAVKIGIVRVEQSDAGVASKDKAIGILVSGDVDPATMKILAFQSAFQDPADPTKLKSQVAAYYPDSAPGSKDKVNVREGRYPIWGPLHVFAKVNPANGAVVSPGANVIISQLAGAPLIGLLNAEIDAQTVPACAMRVKRTTEVGGVSGFSPGGQCHCYFENRTTGSTKCKSCANDGDCAGSGRPKCSFGYCEVK